MGRRLTLGVSALILGLGLSPRFASGAAPQCVEPLHLEVLSLQLDSVVLVSGDADLELEAGRWLENAEIKATPGCCYVDVAAEVGVTPPDHYKEVKQ